MEYEGCDLEAMSQAPKYYKWITDMMSGHFGSTLVEVGAGAGSYSKELLRRSPAKAIFIEPTKNMFTLLEKSVADNAKDTKTKTYNAYLSDVAKNLKEHNPDTFIYINVFEHIEDDLEELKTVKSLLPKGGHVVIFVPAHHFLFSKFDESIGHFRRYNKEMLKKLANETGMEIKRLQYVDMVGSLSWWLNFKLLKRAKLGAGLVGVYDKYLIPVIRTLESNIRTPFGKNVLLIAEKVDE